MRLSVTDFLLILHRAGNVFGRRGEFRGDVLELIRRLDSPACELISADRLRIASEELPDLLQAAADAGYARFDLQARPLPLWIVPRPFYLAGFSTGLVFQL